jgi:hypothetical protein
MGLETRQGVIPRHLDDSREIGIDQKTQKNHRRKGPEPGLPKRVSWSVKPKATVYRGVYNPDQRDDRAFQLSLTPCAGRGRPVGLDPGEWVTKSRCTCGVGGIVQK